MNNDQELAHILKIKFGTAPSEPTSFQLEKIKQDIYALLAKNIIPSESDWVEIVKEHCPGAGNYRYKGVDTTDLMTLMQLATKK